MDASIPVLVLFCKEPRLGHGKQRLAAGIGEQPALRVARAMLDCALEDAACWDGAFVFSPASSEEINWAETLIDRAEFRDKQVSIIAQESGNLGARLAAVDARLRELGATQIVYMGCDAPLLNDVHYDAVLTAQNDVDVVLADGADGGVTLMASRSGWPVLDELPWSSSELGDALADNCAASGRSVHRLDGGFDIDEESDARRLLEHLNGDQRPARQALKSVLLEEFRKLYVTRLPTLSVIIPCRDDAESLARLLPQLSTDDRVEVIVVSHADQHAEIAEVCARNGAQCVVLNEARGARLLKGADMARARNLWFLHADAIVADDAVEGVMQAFADGQVGGYFQFRLLGARSLRKRLIEFAVLVRCKFGGIPYGDQALFVTAAEYRRAGGHEPLPLFDEFRLVRQLQQSDRFGPLPLAVGVDARRWEKRGLLTHTIKNRLYSLAFTFGVSPARLARWYYSH